MEQTYTLKNQLGHSSITQTDEYIKDIIDASERPKRLKGCGLFTDKASISAVDAKTKRKIGNKKTLQMQCSFGLGCSIYIYINRAHMKLRETGLEAQTQNIQHLPNAENTRKGRPVPHGRFGCRRTLDATLLFINCTTGIFHIPLFVVNSLNIK